MAGEKFWERVEIRMKHLGVKLPAIEEATGIPYHRMYPAMRRGSMPDALDARCIFLSFAKLDV